MHAFLLSQSHNLLQWLPQRKSREGLRLAEATAAVNDQEQLAIRAGFAAERAQAAVTKAAEAAAGAAFMAAVEAQESRARAIAVGLCEDPDGGERGAGPDAEEASAAAALYAFTQGAQGFAAAAADKATVAAAAAAVTAAAAAATRRAAVADYASVDPKEIKTWVFNKKVLTEDQRRELQCWMFEPGVAGPDPKFQADTLTRAQLLEAITHFARSWGGSNHDAEAVKVAISAAKKGGGGAPPSNGGPSTGGGPASASCFSASVSAARAQAFANSLSGGARGAPSLRGVGSPSRPMSTSVANHAFARRSRKRSSTVAAGINSLLVRNPHTKGEGLIRG